MQSAHSRATLAAPKSKLARIPCVIVTYLFLGAIRLLLQSMKPKSLARIKCSLYIAAQVLIRKL